MFNDISTAELIRLALPVIIIQLGLLIFCIVKLVKDKVKYLPKWLWFIILFLNIIGPIAYLIFGRERD